MDELINSVSEQLGLDPALTRKAVGAILAFAKDQVGENFDFNKILSQLQGAEALMKDADAEEAAREGIETKPGPKGIIGLIFTLMKIFGVLTMLKQFLKTFFGDSAVQLIESVEEGAELTAVLGKFGISREQGVKMVKMLFDFMKTKLDADTVDQLADNIPAVKAFLDLEDESSKKED